MIQSRMGAGHVGQLPGINDLHLRDNFSKNYIMHMSPITEV